MTGAGTFQHCRPCAFARFRAPNPARSANRERSARCRGNAPRRAGRARLGTSVIVLPIRHPRPLAKELATLHNLSGGRLILGVGFGWLEAEFAALGVPFHERGRRMDEGIALMRAVWSEDPVSFTGKYIAAEIRDMTMLPQPVSPIPM